MAIWIADMLSQCKVTDFRSVKPISCNKRTTHVTSDAAFAMAQYSPSELERATVGCFLDFQLIGELPSKRTKPETDHLESQHAPQSESEKACKVRVLLPCNTMPWPQVE